ncbi:LOW QUALITY PROTEIN: coiled-coil domain-containing protein 177 [Alosa alosa]|uniref:LOW QUALITY PROTEIN: coiled-coil domain-containing protein 177 n=1 Tax=Alosa alosa TaxID=278164 RepID=UPI0020154D7C|nr:LOW QUALITY PROTEIN: coiled-coil domain-containing protein 177 [Alosa alosa]
MEDIRPPSPLLHLDLNNFDRPDAESCRYVLTSPRSLESCSKLGIKPVDLLFKPLSEFVEKNKDMPLGATTKLYEAHEKQRVRLLRLCREERERIIEEGKGIGASLKQFPALETVLEHMTDSQSTETKSRNTIETQRKLENKLVGISLGRRRSVSFSETTSSLATGDPLVQFPTYDGRLLSARSQIGSSNLSLGDLRHSPATERQLERLTRDIQKKMSITVPEKDRKIAALMLVKHEDEQVRQRLSVWEERQRREEQKQEEVRRLRSERLKRKELLRSIRRWQEDLEVRRQLRERQEEEQVGVREQEMALHEERWRRLAEEQETRRMERAEEARREAEDRKRSQERLLHDKEREELEERERERRLAYARSPWGRSRRRTEASRRRPCPGQENCREELRHVLLSREAQEQTRAIEDAKRRMLEQKLIRSGQNRAQVLDARLQELQRRAAREDEQIRRAQLRAGWQSRQRLQEKHILAQLGQQRLEQAEQRARLQLASRVQLLRQENRRKELSHQQLREEAERQEEAERELRLRAAELKDRRCEMLQREREEQLRESRRVAQASFHMRERVREQTSSRTFNKMALEAQLFTSLGKLKM